jgi:outer membrane lipoprotein
MELAVMSMYKPLAAVAAALALAACATVPQPLQGTYTPITAAAAQQGGAGGTQVRWGGVIIKTEPGPQETCFYLLARPLDSQARPESSGNNDSQGRFVACHAGFYDPEVFTRGREVTVTGAIHGTVSQKVGDYDYAYPRVEASVIYLWPKRPIYVSYPYGPGFYDPFWGPGFGPYWGGYGWGGYGGWGYPRYYPGRVFVRPGPHH